MYRNYGPQVGGSRREMGGPPPMAPPSHAANTNDAPPTFKSSTFVYEHDLHGNVVAKYRCGRILGKGGFAKCYEVQDEHMKSFALKVVSNTMLEKPKTMQKLHSEIAIHRRMQHKHVVRFIRTFRDKYNVYMLLELCDSGTLMELLKVRPFSVAETQYVMLQCLSALQYMHENNVIHRDLKPGNIMLDADMNIKIGDFGLAAELHYDGERKRTVCGTPNYIAPEILDRRSQGHSFEVDTWSMGVILYTLLVGQPPFQMEDVESTYSRIRNCSYELPINIPDTARDLIQSILQSRPTNRPTLIDIRTHRFFASSPSSAPSTFLSLAHAPRGDHRGRPIAPAVAVQHGAERCGSAADPKRSRSSRDGRPREMLRPLSANAPVSGEPTSPRCHSAGAKINAAEPRRTPAMMMMDGAALRPPPPTSSGRVEGYVAASTAAPPSQPSTAMAHRRFSDRAPTIHPAAPPPTSTRFGGHFATPALPPPPSSHTNANANVGVRRPVVLDSARSPTTPTTASAGGLDELHHRTTRVAPTPAQPSSSAPAPADEDDERKELTTLHDQLHQTLLEAETRRGTSRPSSSSMRGGRGDAVAQPAEMSHKNNNQQQHQQHDEIKSEDEMKMLAEAPSVWVTHCADFSVKYGLGYYLSNGHVGAHFNDSTKLVWSPQSDEVEYFTRVKVEMRRRNGELGMYSRDQLQTFMMGQHGEEMDKKVLLIKYFRNYLERTHSGKEEVQVERCSCSISPPGRTGRRTPPTRGDLGETTVYVKRWLRTPEALVFRLSNKSVQVCFQDGGEVMLSSEWSVVSYSRPGSSQRRTFPLASVAMESEEANARLRDTKAILYNLIKEHYI